MDARVKPAHDESAMKATSNVRHSLSYQHRPGRKQPLLAGADALVIVEESNVPSRNSMSATSAGAPTLSVPRSSRDGNRRAALT
jgi:hypothetical protein